MVIGTVIFELEITDARTLKDKRRVVRSLLDRLRDTFNISAAELNHLDNPRLATIGAATLANDGRFVHEVLSAVVAAVEDEDRAVVLNIETELL